MLPISPVVVKRVLGAGAALNVSLGFIPSFVMVFNHTDNDIITMCVPNAVLGFTSGGVSEIVAGSKIVGNTSGATARVKDILKISGTWAGGDAAGNIILDANDITGTFANGETLTHYTAASSAVSSADAATTAATIVPEASCSVVLATAAAATVNAITAYVGDADNQRGITLGSTLAENAKHLTIVAFRGE